MLTSYQSDKDHLNYKRSPPPPGTAEMNTDGVPSDENHNSNDQCIVREQDRFMPIANVIRIMRKILPSHAKISDDAKETIQECVSEYISFITSEANDRCQKEQRKTITAEDVLWAMSKLGFDDFIEPLTLYLHRYREFDGCDRGGGSSSSASAIRGDDSQHPVMAKRPAVDPPPSAFHFLPPRHHQQYHRGGLYGTQMAASINGGVFHHVKVDGSNGGCSTSQSANGAHDRLAPTPKDE